MSPSNGRTALCKRAWLLSFLSLFISAATAQTNGGKPVRNDFLGAGQTSLGVWRPSEGNWYLNFGSNGQSVVQWGLAGDIPVPGDYDGDGRTDVAVWRPSDQQWYITLSSTGSQVIERWGLAGDFPVIGGDFDGDGKTDLAVWRPSEGNWYVLLSSSGAAIVKQFGLPGDTPLTADFDGDGRTDYVVWRPSDLNWYVSFSGSGEAQATRWGLPGDIPVVGDYDGDGKSDYAIFRPSEGNWYVNLSSSGTQVTTQWGLPGDTPVAGDFDGDGKTDYAVFRPAEGNWYIVYSSTGMAGTPQQWGLPGDIPNGATLMSVPSETPPSEPPPVQPPPPVEPPPPPVETPLPPVNSPPSTSGFQAVNSTATGGPATSPSTWIGGQVPGRNQQAIIKGPVVLTNDWTTGVYGIVINGGSLRSDGNPHILSIGSYGNDPIGADCGGAVGSPGPCANMFGIVQTRNGGAVDLSNVRIVTPDGVSPIYTRNEVYGDHPSDFSLQNCSIQNLGTPTGSNAYAGMVFATASLPALNVTVNNCTFPKYYRLLHGGTGKGVQSSLTWTNNRSAHGYAMDYGSVVLTKNGFLHTHISNNTDQHSDGSGYYVYLYDIGNSPVVHEVHVQGGAYKRGVYGTLSAADGTGNASISDDLCLNYPGSKGSVACVSIRDTLPSDVNTVISGLVSTGNYETVQLRPVRPNNYAPIHVAQSFLSEDWDTCAGQGVIMIGGMAPIITHNILRVASTKLSCTNNMGFFDYAGTANSVLDNNTIIGTHGASTLGVLFGESGFPVYKQKARNNIIMSWERCVSDESRPPSRSTYLPDSDIGAGVHHNATYDCTSYSYANNNGVGLTNGANTPHPNYSAYGDLDGINPAFADPSYRDVFKYDAQFGGTGDGEWLISQLAAGTLTTAQIRDWIFAGYAPTSQSYRRGYGVDYIGAVAPQ